MKMKETESPAFLALSEVKERFRAGQGAAQARLLLERIEALNPKLNVYLSLNQELLREAARPPRSGTPLEGVFVSLKDLIATRGMPTTAGSRVPLRLARGDATLVGRLRAAGALLVGKTNLHEFAYGVTSENEHFGPVRNPWQVRRTSGGSSGGSAVALAAGLCTLSVGTDTRGSIRIPSACCGTVGLKPTPGLVPMGGVVPLSPTLDTAGPMARTTRDLAVLLEVLAGSPAGTYTVALSRGVEGMTLGLCRDYLEGVDPVIGRALERVRRRLERGGVRVREVEIPGLGEIVEASGKVSRVEALAYHDRDLRARPGDYGPRVRRRLETGYSVSGLEYVRAREVARRSVALFRRLFRRVDLLLAAVIPALPPRIGRGEVRVGGRREPVVPAFVRFNAAQNMAGVPALALPCGFTPGGLPLGCQLIAGRGCEDLLLAAGAWLERCKDWPRRRPRLA